VERAFLPLLESGLFCSAAGRPVATLTDPIAVKVPRPEALRSSAGQSWQSYQINPTIMHATYTYGSRRRMRQVVQRQTLTELGSAEMNRAQSLREHVFLNF